MLKQEQLDEILKRLPYHQVVKEDIETITYYQDVFMAGDTQIMFRHIDIDMCYGDFLEIQEEDEVFSYIVTICHKDLSKEESIILYQKE